MNYYNVLGVSKNSRYDEIRQKYKELSMKYYQNGSEQFKLINKAYSVLSDPYKRGRYDAMLENQGFYISNPYSGFNFGLTRMNIFDNFFNMEPAKMNTSFQKSYSSSTFQKMDKDGKIKTTKTVNINNNGNKDEFYQEYYIDKHGNRQIIRESGNKMYMLKQD